MLSSTSRLRIAYLSYFSKPARDRLIYRTIRGQKVRKILELGIGIGQRAVRMIQVAGHSQPLREMEFIGMDRFEDRSSADGPGVTLKLAHRLLHATGARVRLVPGDPFSGLSQVANEIGQVDLIVISRRLDPQHLARAWFYVPRLLHEHSHVFLEGLLPGGRTSLRSVDRSEIEALAAAVSRRRAA